MLIFNSLEALREAIKTIWALIVKEEFANNPLTIYDGNLPCQTLDGLTDEQISPLIIRKSDNQHIGITDKYSENNQIYGETRWYLKKPETRFMTGVTGYTEESFDPAWLPPEE